MDLKRAFRKWAAPLTCAATALLLLHAPAGYGRQGQLPPAVENPPAAPPAPPGLQTPRTQSILRLTPESATFTLALPPVTNLYDKACLLARRLAPADMDFVAGLNDTIERLAQWAGVPEAKTLPEILRARGLDPGAPFGIFLNLAPTVAKAQEAVKVIGSRKAWWQEIPAPAGRTPACDWLDFDSAGFVAVLGCSDPELAERGLQQLVSSLFGPEALHDELGGDVVIHACEGIAYCVADHLLFVTNDVPMLRQTLARMVTPCTVRYGSAACPAGRPDEIVLLTRLDELKGLLPDLTSFLENCVNPEQDVRLVNQAMHRPADLFAGEDPCITTLDVFEDRIELVSRLDLATHPQYAAYVGEARPIRLGTLLPEDCQAFACIQLTAAVKDLLRKRWGPLLSDLGNRSKGVGPLDLAAGEVAVGVSIAGTPVPRAFLLAEVAHPDTVKSLLAEVAPEAAWEEDSRAPGAQFTQLDVRPALAGYVALCDNVVLVANDREASRVLAAAVLAEKRSRLLESLAPAVDPATGIFGVFSLTPESLNAMVRLFAADAVPPEGQGIVQGVLDRIMDKITGIAREFRAGKIVQDGWHRVFLTIHFR